MSASSQFVSGHWCVAQVMIDETTAVTSGQSPDNQTSGNTGYLVDES